MNYFKEALAVPFQLGKYSFGLGVKIGGYTLAQAQALGIPRRPEKPIAERLQEQAPLHDALLGRGQVMQGIEHGDEQLTQLGAGAIALALLRANDSPNVSDAVTEEVVGIAEGLPINPAESPLLDSATGERAASVVKQFTSE
jgi:hypothetical protein